MNMEFVDKVVSYDTFVHDLASRICDMMLTASNEPERVSQRQAYKIFGKRNVMRWLASGKLHPSKRPGKVEYETRELRLVQRTEQDYL